VRFDYQGQAHQVNGGTLSCFSGLNAILHYVKLWSYPQTIPVGGASFPGVACRPSSTTDSHSLTGSTTTHRRGLGDNARPFQPRLVPHCILRYIPHSSHGRSLTAPCELTCPDCAIWHHYRLIGLKWRVHAWLLGTSSSVAKKNGM
jgi:hypothetical protein